VNFSWVLSNQAQIDPTVEIFRLKQLGSFWGGWRTWRSCQTDNVICYDQAKAAELVQRDFHKNCNFFIPNHVYLDINRPEGVQLYQGEFKHDVDNHEDIVAMHLASGVSDIVLLLGFDFGEQPKLEDKFLEHCAHNYRSLVRQVIVDSPQVQWVVIDHAQDLRKDLQELPNFGKDTLQNILNS
jgi:hypothetical protein